MKEITTTKDIGKSLKNLRKYKNITQLELSSMLGISRGTYNSYENGTARIPAIVLSNIAKLLNVSIDMIMNNSFADNSIVENEAVQDVITIVAKGDPEKLRFLAEAYRKSLEAERMELNNNFDKLNESGKDFINNQLESMIENPLFTENKS